MAYAPGGPFLPAPPLPRCNNPAPWLMKNGTWLIVCEGFQLWRADTVWGPWAHVTTIRSSAGAPIPGAYEDPFFFVDAQGHFHVIYHVYRTTADAHNCLPGHDGAVVSGHYFSMDGFTWRASSVSPYGNVVNLTDGTAQLLTTRERPKMLFNAASQPTHLSNGVCPSPGGWNTPIACPEVSTGCVDCSEFICAPKAPTRASRWESLVTPPFLAPLPHTHTPRCALARVQRLGFHQRVAFAALESKKNEE